MVVYATSLLLIAASGFYILFYLFFLTSFVVLAVLINRSKAFDLIDSFTLQKKLLSVFLIALMVRFLMLAQSQIITDDILNYVSRGEQMLSGRIPYVDFYGGSKPPLHNLVLLNISWMFGAGEIQLRAAFSAVDALIAILVLFLCGQKRPDRFALSASLLYALSPINVITIGLSGHFDPVPTLAMVLSVIFLVSRRFRSSSLFLGFGFALKVFATVLLPYYISEMKAQKERVLNVLIFLLPMVLSLAGLYLLSEQGPIKYLNETSGWGGWWSFSHILSVAIGSSTLGPLKISWIFMGSFLLLILVMYASLWARKGNEDGMTIFWFKVVVLIFVVYWGLMILDAWAQAPAGTNILPFILVLIIYSLLAAFLMTKFKDSIFPAVLCEGRTERILIIFTLALTLFCFGLPNYAPWYTIWFLPLLLSIRTQTIRLTLLFLSIWHIMGKGVSIFPGLPPIN